MCSRVMHTLKIIQKQCFRFHVSRSTALHWFLFKQLVIFIASVQTWQKVMAGFKRHLFKLAFHGQPLSHQSLTKTSILSTPKSLYIYCLNLFRLYEVCPCLIFVCCKLILAYQLKLTNFGRSLITLNMCHIFSVSIKLVVKHAACLEES